MTLTNILFELWLEAWTLSWRDWFVYDTKLLIPGLWGISAIIKHCTSGGSLGKYGQVWREKPPV